MAPRNFPNMARDCSPEVIILNLDVQLLQHSVKRPRIRCWNAAPSAVTTMSDANPCVPSGPRRSRRRRLWWRGASSGESALEIGCPVESHILPDHATPETAIPVHAVSSYHKACSTQPMAKLALAGRHPESRRLTGKPYPQTVNMQTLGNEERRRVRLGCEHRHAREVPDRPVVASSLPSPCKPLIHVRRAGSNNAKIT